MVSESGYSRAFNWLEGKQGPSSFHASIIAYDDPVVSFNQLACIWRASGIDILTFHNLSEETSSQDRLTSARKICELRPSAEWNEWVDQQQAEIARTYPSIADSALQLLELATREASHYQSPLVVIHSGVTISNGESVAILWTHEAFRIDRALTYFQNVCSRA